MLNILSSRSTHPNEGFREVLRDPGEDNLEWIGRVASEANDGPDGAQTDLVLLGGVSICAFRLRAAQSHLRHDLTPSHWSHVVLLAGSAEDKLDVMPVLEISLEPERGFGFPPVDNAVQDGRLSVYRSRRQYPNIALLRLSVERSMVTGMLRKEGAPPPHSEKDALADFRRQRASLDAVDLLVAWLAFAWGVGAVGNPLLQGHGIPSAAMIEVVLAACRYDVTPGLENRSSCPEAIWQAGKWWQAYYAQQEKTPPAGAWTVEHVLPEGRRPRRARDGGGSRRVQRGHS